MYINIPFSKTFLTPLPKIIPLYLPCSREASSMVAHACLLEGGFRIKVQCIKNKIKNKSKLKSGRAGGNWVNRKYLFIKASLQANQVFFPPSGTYTHPSVLPSHPSVCQTAGDQSPEWRTQHLAKEPGKGSSMLCWHWNSLKAVQRSTRTQITGWFKKPTAHRPGNHTVGRFFIAHW